MKTIRNSAKKVVFPHLLNLARACAKDYLSDPENNSLDGVIAGIYFRAAYGLENLSSYEQMASCFNLDGEV